MKNKKGFVLSILLFLFIFGVTIPLFMTNIKVKADTISDLTNTTWILNDTISSTDFGKPVQRASSYSDVQTTSNYGYLINFNSTSYSNTWLGFVRVSSIDLVSMPSMMAFSGGETIEINGGTDATNSTLISWLQNNATQQINGITITQKYWTADTIIMQDDDRIGDDDIQYKVLYNEFTDTYTNTIQTGLIFVGVQTEQTPAWSYIESINGSGINILYHNTNNTLANTMLLEFTIGDTMDTDLFNLMTLNGHWFDDYDAYSYGRTRGYHNGLIEGRALGQADGTQYTGLVTGIFNGLGDILSVQVFPNITIGLLIGLPLLLGAFIIIIKILRG